MSQKQKMRNGSWCLFARPLLETLTKPRAEGEA